MRGWRGKRETETMRYTGLGVQKAVRSHSVYDGMVVRGRGHEDRWCLWLWWVWCRRDDEADEIAKLQAELAEIEAENAG